MQYILTEEEYKKIESNHQVTDENLVKFENQTFDFNNKPIRYVIIEFMKDGATTKVALSKDMVAKLLTTFIDK